MGKRRPARPAPVVKATVDDEMAEDAAEDDSEVDIATASEGEESDGEEASGSAGGESDGDPGNNEEEEDDMDTDSQDAEASRRAKLRDTALNVEANVKKSGVVYLSSIPPGMNVAKLREIMSQYGALGRIYLEPDTKGGPKRRKPTDSMKHGQKYLEGWIEFKRKSVAKKVAACLNNSQIGGKRRSPYYESLWNIKYLNRFKWNHLTERLVHEKITRQHRLRQEIAQAKRQTNFFSQNIEKSKMLERIKRKKSKEGGDFAPLKTFEMRQRLTDAEIRSQPRSAAGPAVAISKSRTPAPPDNGIKNVLANLFPKR
ncbi:putative Pre-rRNA-processing protein esf2 [Hypsibius exemplaris]|uniref:Activator of basal transcription 1 n=1 Tax=Hypsibius exemplaris TaxID=2072580 RepID=A0A1W0X4I7_HYPEX|nr:putative Pre-rRNA-processing protein esf2 [Hypsibius exemplaris]